MKENLTSEIPKIFGKRAEISWKNVEPLVFAFYYIWYEKEKGMKNAAHRPKIGEYSSDSNDVISYHFDLCRKAGIDCLIVSWGGKDNKYNNIIPFLLNEGYEKGVKISLYYEEVPSFNREDFVDEIVYILKNYSSHPAYLKLGDKPVIFFYDRITMQMSPVNIALSILDIEKIHSEGIVAIGGGFSYINAQIFDGVHEYFVGEEYVNKNLNEIKKISCWKYNYQVKLLEEKIITKRKISCLPIIPGYDDIKIRNGFKIERFDGKLYQILWKQAIKAKPDWILITSFNEWWEGTEIEPSEEYGEKYINMTKIYSKMFKK